MKSRVMKKQQQLTSKKIKKCTVEREKSVLGLLQTFSPNPGTCHVFQFL